MVAEGKRASLPLAVCSERELGLIVGTVFERLLTASELLFLVYAGALSLASQNLSFEKISSYEISRVEADGDREDVILQQDEFESTIENEDARICLIGKAAQAAQVAECKDDAESDDDDEDDDDEDDDAEEGDDDDDDAEEGEDDDDDDVPVNNPADDEDDEDENGNEEDDDDDDDDDDDEEDEDDDEDDEEDDDEDEEPPAKKKK